MRILVLSILFAAVSAAPAGAQQEDRLTASDLYISCSLLLRGAEHVDGPETALVQMQPAMCRELALAAPLNWTNLPPPRYSAYCPPSTGPYASNQVRETANAFLRYYESMSGFGMQESDGIAMFRAALAASWPCQH